MQTYPMNRINEICTWRGEYGKPEKIKIFEGWFDFLSYLKLSRASDFKAIILNSTANLSFQLMLDILKENEVVDLYLDNDVTGDKYTNSFTRVSQLYRYCLQNGLTTDWDFKALRSSRDKMGKLLISLNICSSKAKNVWKIYMDVSDQRNHYAEFMDINEFLMGRKQN